MANLRLIVSILTLVFTLTVKASGELGVETGYLINFNEPTTKLYFSIWEEVRPKLYFNPYLSVDTSETLGSTFFFKTDLAYDLTKNLQLRGGTSLLKWSDSNSHLSTVRAHMGLTLKLW